MKLHNAARLLVGAVFTTSIFVVSLPAPALAQQGRAVGPPTFAVLQPAPRIIRLPCCRCLDGKRTNVNVSTGTVPWNVAFGNSAAQPAALTSNVAWAPVPPGHWIGTGSETAGNYTFQMPFQVPRCVIPMQVTISGKFAADNSAKLYIEGNLVASSLGTPNYGFLPGSVTPFTWSGPLVPGAHSIKVVVTNSDGPTGLVVAATITVTCPNLKDGEYHSSDIENPN
jgi:hypothetical protein